MFGTRNNMLHGFLFKSYEATDCVEACVALERRTAASPEACRAAFHIALSHADSIAARACSPESVISLPSAQMIMWPAIAAIAYAISLSRNIADVTAFPCRQGPAASTPNCGLPIELANFQGRPHEPTIPFVCPDLLRGGTFSPLTTITVEVQRQVDKKVQQRVDTSEQQQTLPRPVYSLHAGSVRSYALSHKCMQHYSP